MGSIFPMIGVVLFWLSICDGYVVTKTVTIQIEAFKRQKYPNRFLKVNKNQGAVSVSFTGFKNENGTKFERTTTFNRTSNRVEFALIRPTSMSSNSFLAVEGGRLLVKQSVSNSPTDMEYKFKEGRLDLCYNNQDVLHLTMIFSLTRPDTLIKGTKHGNVSLGHNWNDCATWLIITNPRKAGR